MRCARGCLRPGYHVPGCGGCECACHNNPRRRVPCDVGGGHCNDMHEGCTGCDTAPAEYGLLCARCSRILRDLLGAREAPDGPHGFPWIYDWLGENLDPSTRPKGSDGRGGRHGPPDPIRIEVLDVQALIGESLRGWMEAVIRSVPHARLTGPKQLSVASISSWLLAQIAVVEAAPFVDDVVTTLDEIGGEAHRCAPWRPANHILHGVPCPWCLTHALRIRGGEIDVTCGHCGAWIPHARYRMWETYLADSVSQDARKRAKV